MNLQIYEEASDWIVKHRDGGLDAREKKYFDAWLRESPQHMRAYLEMSSVWEDVPTLDPTWNPSADELVARARADDNVVSLSSPSHVAAPLSSRTETADDGTHGSESDRRATAAGTFPRFREASAQAALRLTGEEVVHAKRKARFIYALAASILIMVASGWLYLQRGVYTTDIGEQRSLALTDGSTVELNSRSRIKVQYTEYERRIDLLEGQALFQVAKNKTRPFVVQTGNTRVRAVGTAFDVYRASSGTVVTVVEGRVAVHSKERLEGAASARPQNSGDSSHASSHAPEALDAGTENASRQAHGDATGSASPQEAPGIQAIAGEVLLAAGEQIIVSPLAVVSLRRANVAAATAWTRRSLVFDSSPLTEVAQEFNRYNTRPLVIKDPQLADFHVSGVFSSVEPSLLLRFLRTQPELVVEETDTEIRISKK